MTIEGIDKHPDFSKVYAKWRRLTHHHCYLACLFQIQDKRVR